jgi:nucleoside-diphosphate-sugar epimerase
VKLPEHFGSLVITGAGGFLGRYFVDRLHVEGKKFVAVVRRPVRNIPHIIADLENKEEVKRLRGQLPSLVLLVHLASRVQETHEAAKANVHMMQNLLETLHDHIGGVVYSSSASVYGPFESTHTYFEDDRLEPHDLYGQSKLAAEQMVSDYSMQKGIPYLNLRFSSIVGPGEPHGKAISILINCLVSDRVFEYRPTLVGRRDYLDVRDAASALDLVVDMIGSIDSGSYNVSAGLSTSVPEMVNALEDVSCKRVRFAVIGKCENQVAICFSRAKIGKAVGWEPCHPLRDTLQTMWEHRYETPV